MSVSAAIRDVRRGATAHQAGRSVQMIGALVGFVVLVLVGSLAFSVTMALG